MTLQALREALKPFAEIADLLPDHRLVNTDAPSVMAETLKAVKPAIGKLTLGHFRRAKEALALTVPGETEIDGLIASLIEATTVLGEPFHHDAIAATMTKAAEALRHLSSRSLDGCKARNAVIEECLLETAKQRCERDTPWDMALLAAMKAIRALKEAKPVRASQGKDDTK